MTSATSASQKRPRGPGTVHGVTAVILLIALAAVALTARQPPPPNVAEFAPQAVEKIKDAPNELSGRFGSGGEGTGAFASTSTTLAKGAASDQKIIDVARVRRCIGNPPRQIEDPQSPPCVAYWDGDNGGATWKGVTRDTITVAVPNFDPGEDPNLQTFFNTRFEFYGRKLKLVAAPASDATAASQRSSAIDVDTKLHAFASLGEWAGTGLYYHEELKNRQILSSVFFPSYDSAYLARNAPYIWQYPMALDREADSIGQWACARLAGKKASHAGRSDAIDMSTQTRVFGLVVHFPADNQFNIKSLNDRLTRCGSGAAIQLINSDPGSYASSQYGTNEVLQLKNKHVTSVICLCVGGLGPGGGGVASLGTAASSQGYFPEWILGSYFMLDDNEQFRLAGLPSDQRVHAFGTTYRPRQLNIVNEPWYWAMKDANPAFGANPNISWGWWRWKYQELLLLASGIQMAGPNLTPATFAAGLHKTTFPNPDHPNNEGKVGFSGLSQTMTIDGTEWWWSNTDRAPYSNEGAGTICYVAGGARHLPGSWPSSPGDPFFSEPCDSGA